MNGIVVEHKLKLVYGLCLLIDFETKYSIIIVYRKLLKNSCKNIDFDKKKRVLYIDTQL